MTVEMGTVAAQFLFWEYLSPIFDIGSLQRKRQNNIKILGLDIWKADLGSTISETFVGAVQPAASQQNNCTEDKLQGLCHEMNNIYFWRLIMINMYFLYIFLFLNWMKNQTQSFSLLLWNYWLILKILPVTRFKGPKAAIVTLKMLTGSHLWFCKIIPKAAGDKLILAHFPCS